METQHNRVAAGLKKLQASLTELKARDVNESGTVVIVTDLLHELFGYDNYSDIRSRLTSSIQSRIQ